MSKKWYNLFVSVDQTGEGSPEEAPRAGDSAARTVAQIAASVAAEPQFTTPVNNPTCFEEIYRAAEIRTPQHGYSVFKVGEMLQSEHIRGLPAEVRRSSVLVALEAAGVKLAEVIEDAVRRDRALDTYERVLQKSVEELEARKAEENRKTEAEMQRLVAEYRARIQASNDEVAKEKERFYGWRLQKQQEEKKIADAVSYFVSENPITTSGAAAAPPPGPKAQGS
jgi:Asp-tRNA(Asn)/Glu-tRNA(Gln) amidotransferase A subunit family amidase